MRIAFKTKQNKKKLKSEKNEEKTAIDANVIVNSVNCRYNIAYWINFVIF